MGESTRNNFDIILKVIRRYPDIGVLGLVGTDLWSNPYFITTIIKDHFGKNGAKLILSQKANPVLLGDKTFMLELVQFAGNLLMFAADELKDDQELVIAAVSKNGNALQYASARLRDDAEVVSAAVAKKGAVLKYASERLKDKEEIVRLAMRENPQAIKLAGERIRNLLN